MLFKNKAFYTKISCSICGEETGFKGNKRFKLEDGYMCQPCAEKTTPKSAFVVTYSPNAFRTESIEKIKEIIRLRSGD